MEGKRNQSAAFRFSLVLLCLVLLYAPTLGAELTILTWMGVDHVPLYRELLDEFEAEHGVTVNIIRTGVSALWEKLDTMTIAGTCHDRGLPISEAVPALAPRHRGYIRAFGRR